MPKKQVILVDLSISRYCYHLLKLLNDYMEDEMGASKSMPHELSPKIIEGLKRHSAYLGFFVCVEGDFAALANCNLNYSTWQAKFLININDFIVLQNSGNKVLASYY